MTVRGWWTWLTNLPWVLRWFVLLLLFRPIVDVLYYLKDISPFFSPPYLVGGLTPIAITMSMLSKRMPKIQWSILDILFLLWGTLMLFNGIAVLASGITTGNLEVAFKLSSPVLIYFFLRHVIRSKRDLDGLLTTFLYSSMPVFGMMLFESLVTPIDHTPTFTRGFYRYSGLFADIVDYSVYFIGALFVSGYLYLSECRGESRGKSAVRLGIVTWLTVMGLIHIHHNMSWAVSFALLGLILLHTVRQGKVGLAATFLSMCTLIGVFVFDDAADNVSHGYANEIAVLEGHASEERAFHGRVSRWSHYLELWDDESAIPQFLGVSLASTGANRGMLFGIHDDYLRILFSSGVVGLGIYLLFYARLLFETLSIPGNAERFLIRGGVAIMLLFSVSTVPTLYFGLLYLCLSIFAYGAYLQPGKHRVEMVRDLERPRRQRSLYPVPKV